jgi:CPA2 family monovalent cation:H+ antiporter-2
MEIPLLKDIVIIFGLSIVVILLFHKIRVPTIIGFLLTGMLAGPYGLKLIDSIHGVELLAEVGVVLLLFTIGIEFSVKNLIQIRKSVLMGGSLQVFLTTLSVFFIARLLDLSFAEAVFAGFLVALSSTAIVLKIIQQQAQVDTPHGSTTLGILIFQDIIIVPMILVTPILAGATENVGGSLLVLAAKGIGIIGLMIISAKWIVPYILFHIAQTRSRELFLLSIILICLSVAWITSSAGLSLALGAFLAGLIISESEYSHQTLGDILPFRDVFMSFFFISIGMLLDVDFLFQHPVTIVLVAIGIILLKSIIAGSVTLLMGFPLRIGILVGLALCQVGEFSFILSRTGVEYGLLDGFIYQMFLTSSVLTMAATPFIITLAPRLADDILKLPLPKRLISGYYSYPCIKAEVKKDHLIIIGFGVNGRNVARAARAAGISYIIIEMNPETVKSEQAHGEPIYYGDATHEAVLAHANIKDARIGLIAINDPAATRRITEVFRRFNPKIHLIVRTRFLQEMEPLYELGADQVIPEEFETSVELFSRVLAYYLIPREEIEKLVFEIRSDGYEMFRSLSKESTSFSNLSCQLPDVEIVTYKVSGKSPVVNKTLSDIDLRKKYGVTLLVIRRDSQIISNPDGSEQLYSGDVLIVLGQPEKNALAMGLFQ